MASSARTAPINENAIWFINVNGEQRGPLKTRAVLNSLAEGVLTSEDWIWREGFTDWSQIGQLEIFGVRPDSDRPHRAASGNFARYWRGESSLPVNASFSERWVRTIPRRWLRNGAILGAIVAFAPHGTSKELLLIMQNLSSVIQFVLAIALTASLFGLAGGLIGLWARWSLPFGSADWPLILSRIYRNWVIGALALVTIMILADAALQWRAISPFVSGDHFGNIAYLLGSYGAAALVGFLIAVVSRRGLTRSLKDDDNFMPRKG